VINVLLVGLGRIAIGSGESLSKGNLQNGYRSHFDVIQRHPNFRLVACVDPDESAQNKISSLCLGTQIFSDLDSAIASNIQMDLAVICSPTFLHKSHVRKLLDAPIGFIFCEKPLSVDIGFMDEYFLNERKVNVTVNYTRYWDETTVSMIKQYRSGSLGELTKANIVYGRGVKNNASHALQLISLFCSDLKIEKLYSAAASEPSGDLNVDATLLGEGGRPRVLLTSIGSDAYFTFDLHLYFQKAVFTILNGGESWVVRYRSASQNHYGEFTLGSPMLVKGTNGEALLHAYKAINDFLVHGKSNFPDLKAVYASESLSNELYNLGVLSLKEASA
jgi:hypothetical protein